MKEAARVPPKVSRGPCNPADMLLDEPPQVLRNGGGDPNVLPDDDAEVSLAVTPEAEFPVLGDAPLVETSRAQPLVVKYRGRAREEGSEPQVAAGLQAADRRCAARPLRETKETGRSDLMPLIADDAMRLRLFDRGDRLREEIRRRAMVCIQDDHVFRRIVRG